MSLALELPVSVLTFIVHTIHAIITIAASISANRSAPVLCVQETRADGEVLLGHLRHVLPRGLPEKLAPATEIGAFHLPSAFLPFMLPKQATQL